ncbi:MAG: RnfABCDGE type electron transport complex subunit D [Cetobacterium sp.]|uniref:Ion-translocating oxidoreductase complex subunit D n=2 Tax=Cetobacterium ceti TaxID=180163 RepID=A0A1T4PM06_9FUSO|nr:RnfABCDGE type electron transport complex subunit D [Cetobacterium ceti]MCJ8341646.1 RnfABCDGE type electron transport complex subunit D [Cetobacterium sp.]SJZ92296.1 electron transport complex protein RnfD [Cetobacterium ceti]
MAKIFRMGPSPHIRTKETTEDVMYDVIIALIPALLASWYFFGIRAISVVAVSVFTCMLSEYICQKIMKRDIEIFDGSAAITGILYAFVIPPYMSYWYIVTGAAVSIVLGKMLFGGLGHNIFNPALVGRAFIQASWPVAITTFMYDSVAGPTILDAMKRGLGTNVALIDKGNLYANAFFGRMGGCLGETSALALLIGGLYLIYKKQVDWRVPLIIIGTVFVITLASGADPIMHIFSGGLFLGAFFMATDMVTSPHNIKGRVIFALGVGILISLIRLKGGYPEGTAFAILIMNGFVPLINRYTKPKRFGEVKVK